MLAKAYGVRDVGSHRIPSVRLTHGIAAGTQAEPGGEQRGGINVDQHDQRAAQPEAAPEPCASGPVRCVHGQQQDGGQPGRGRPVGLHVLARRTPGEKHEHEHADGGEQPYHRVVALAQGAPDGTDEENEEDG